MYLEALRMKRKYAIEKGSGMCREVFVKQDHCNKKIKLIAGYEILKRR